MCLYDYVTHPCSSPCGRSSAGGPGPGSDGGAEVGHGDLLGAVHGGGHLLLVLLGEEGQHLTNDGAHPLDNLGLWRNANNNVR